MKKISTLLAAIMLLAVIAACGSSSSDKMSEIKKAGTIVLGTSADYAPYEFHKNIDGKDTIVGFDIEIAKAIAADMGVKLEIKDMGFDGLIAALSAGKIDFVISGMTPNEERKKNVDFSSLYYNAEQIILVRTEDKDKFKSMNDFNKDSVQVGVQTGSIQEDLAKEQLPKVKLKSIGKITDLALELKNKKVDAVIMESPVAKGYVVKNTDLTISSVKPKAEEAGSAVAVKKDNPELIAQINKTLDRLIKDKAIDQFVTEASVLSLQ